MLEAYLKRRQISTVRHRAPSQKAVILNLDIVPQVECILCTRLVVEIIALVMDAV
jgi:hypothetical protein